MSKNTFLLSIDQGTTGTTVLILNLSLSKEIGVIAKVTESFPQYYPQADWVEHDLDEVWTSVVVAVKKAISLAEKSSTTFKVGDIAAIGITNQRETLCFYNHADLKPLRKAIVWQCKRSTTICEKLKADGHQELFKSRTGLLLDPYFSGTKWSWVMRNEPRLAEQIKSGKVAVGTIDTFLLSRLTGGKVYATEASNASRTLYYNIHTGAWEEELLQILGLPKAQYLPEIKNSAGHFGKTLGMDCLPDGIPIAGILGDQQAALAGQGCYKPGEAKCTYGTGAFLLLNLGPKPILSQHHLLTTVAWSVRGKLTYALEGSAFIAGAAVQFARDNLSLLQDAKESQSLAAEVSASPQIYFVPALSGLGAPHWDPKAKGAYLGLTRSTTRAQLIRSTLEGVAFQVGDLINCMRQDYGKDVLVLRVDGGACVNDTLMEFQAHVANMAIERPKLVECTALGAALFAGLGVGVFEDLTQAARVFEREGCFLPVNNRESELLREKQWAGWKKAVEAVRLFAS